MLARCDACYGCVHCTLVTCTSMSATENFPMSNGVNTFSNNNKMQQSMYIGMKHAVIKVVGKGGNSM